MIEPIYNQFRHGAGLVYILPFGYGMPEYYYKAGAFQFANRNWFGREICQSTMLEF